MDRFLQNDGWVKLISIVLAVLLWVTVATQQTKQEELFFDNLELRVFPAPPEYVILDGPKPGEVKVRLVGKGSRLQLSRIDPKSLEPYIDLSVVARTGAREAIIGVQSATGAQLPAGVQWVAEPSRIPVYVAKSLEKSMPVRVFPSPGDLTLEGRDAQYTATARPTSVVISGPTEYVNRVAQLQINLQPTEVTRAGTVAKQPVAVDDRNNIVPFVQVPPVEVDIAIRILPPSKSVLVRPVFRGALPGGYQYTVAVDPQTVTIRGDVSLTGIEDVRTEPIDLTGKTTNFETTVGVIPPAETTVDQKDVTVAVTVTEVAEERTYQVTLQVMGKAVNTDSLTVPPEVQVRLKGFRRLLDQVGPETLVAYVDVEGLSPGKHTLPVRIQPPGQGLELLDYQPRTADVVIEEK